MDVNSYNKFIAVAFMKSAKTQ